MRHNWAPFSSFHQRQPQQYPTNLSSRFTYLHASFGLLLGTNSDRPCVCPTLRLKHICGCDSKWLGPANWVSLPSFTNQPTIQRRATPRGSAWKPPPAHTPFHPEEPLLLDAPLLLCQFIGGGLLWMWRLAARCHSMSQDGEPLLDFDCCLPLPSPLHL